MKEYKITIKVAEEKVSAENIEEARKIAKELVRDIYLRLNCEYTVKVDVVKEVE